VLGGSERSVWELLILGGPRSTRSANWGLVGKAAVLGSGTNVLGVG
jgi:hypothetical protein